MRRNIFLFLILILFLLLFGCNKNSTADNPVPSPNNSEAPVEPAEVSILENEGDIEITIPEDMESDGF